MSSVIPDNRSGAWLSVMILIALVVTGLFIGSAITGILTSITGLGINTEMSGPGNTSSRMLVRLYLIINQIFTFLLPAYLYYRFFSNPDSRRGLFALGAATRIPVIFLSVCLLFASLPIVVYSYEINHSLLEQLDWTSDGSTMPRVLRTILQMEIPPEFWANLLLVALLPAIGEELIFRGYLMRFLQKGTASIHLGIWLSAAAFSAFHFQIEGFLPRFVLGLVLGYSFHWTRSLWIPMFLHFINNGLQVVAIYMGMEEYSELKLEEIPSIPIILVIASGLCIFLSARLIKRYARQSI